MSDKSNLKGQVVRGLFWKFGERTISQGVSFIISLVLARILMPEQYGLVSLVLVFINIANVFVTDGLGASLIQRKDASEKDFSTMFFCSLGMGCLLYVLLFLAAPYIADFYGNADVTGVLRVLGIQVPLSAIKTIQQAYVEKNMVFKKFFFSTLGGAVVSGSIGILMAYKGFGVWALVEQYLVSCIMEIVILSVTVKWRPHFIFDFQAAKRLFSFGWKLMAAQFINVFYNELRSLVIGKKYTESDLAYYSKGNHLPSLVITNINTSISAVLFPALSKVNGSANAVKALTRKSMKMTAYVIFPMMIGMFVIAEPMIELLLTEKWLPCVPFLRLSCLYWMFQPCQTANVQAIKAMGRSDVCLKLEVVKKLIGFCLVFITMQISVYAMVASNVIFAGISALINILPNRKLIGYGLWEQIKDQASALGLSIVMGVATYCVTFVGMSAFPTLIIQVIVGISVYLIISALFRVDAYKIIKGIVFNRKENSR